MTISISEPPKELVNIKLLISSDIELMSKTSNVVFNGGRNKKPCFL